MFQPTCTKCGQPHWRFAVCPDVPVAPVNTAPLHVVYRPREGYQDRGDRMLPDTVRMGSTTFARRRVAGDKHGAFRDRGDN